MKNVLLSDVIGSARPRTYLVRDGQIVVRAREGEFDEGVRDFLKSVAKRVASGATKAIRKVTGRDKKSAEVKKKKPDPAPEKAKPTEPEKKPEPEKKKPDPPAGKTSQQKRAETVAKRRKAETRQALANNKKARQEKKATKVSSAAAGAEKTGKVNAQLAHCILALHYKRGKSVRGAWNICRASLTKNGYLKGPYREGGKVSDTKATSKGSRRAMQHAMEKKPLGGGIPGDPHKKFQKFRKIFRDIEPTV